MDAKTNESAGKCPIMHARTNRDWWPSQLNIQVLHLWVKELGSLRSRQ